MEKDIQAKVIKYLKSVPELWFVKAVISNRRGVPDIMICYKGLFIAFEVKTDDGQLSELQILNERLITRAGGIFAVVRNVDQVKGMINTIGTLSDKMYRKEKDK